MTLGRMIGSEVRRYLSRRLARTLAGLAVLAVLIAGLTVFLTHSADDPSEKLFRITLLREAYVGTAIPLFLLSWILAASFVGAEWHAGTMGTLLTWEPRRLRVILAKAGVAVAMGFAGTVLLQALLGVVLLPAAALHGSTAGTDATWWRETVETVLRGATVSAVAAGIGFSLSSIGRNTGAALGVGFGYLIIVEQVIGGLRPGWRPWLLLGNIFTFLSGEADLGEGITHSVASAGLLLVAYAAGLVLVATVLFRQRDVT